MKTDKIYQDYLDMGGKLNKDRFDIICDVFKKIDTSVGVQRDYSKTVLKSVDKKELSYIYFVLFGV